MKKSEHGRSRSGVLRGRVHAHPSLGPKKAGCSGAGAARIGAVENFRIGDRGGVEQVLAELRALKLADLRTTVSWADWDDPLGADWYRWLLPRLAQEITVVPCLLYTPPAHAVAPHRSAPPWDPDCYGDFVAQWIEALGDCFEWLELWNEPDRLSEWDRTRDRQWQTFCAMIGGAAYHARRSGKRVVLGGLRVFDPHWLELMFRRGVMQCIDAVGVHGFPGEMETRWPGWLPLVETVRGIVRRHDSGAEIWISAAGHSTWRHDEHEQLRVFAEIVEAPVERIYWHTLRDSEADAAPIDSAHDAPRADHYGLHRSDGSAKLLARLWAGGGLAAVQQTAAVRTAMGARALRAHRPVVITGGAGFIGTNLAHRLASQGEQVLIVDNLSRSGTERNLAWLRETHGDRIDVGLIDVRNPAALAPLVRRARQVFHFAAQVAVTTSLTAPRHDFEVNALGTLNLLEALRSCGEPVPLVFTSTNKVYGNLEDVALSPGDAAYRPLDMRLREYGIDEIRPLDLKSPYGCSKGAADQYVLDYARTLGLPATVFRMSCIYGPHQMGTEDQGWVAHFLICALEERPITLYGDGLQVRDVLYVDDLIDAFLLARSHIDSIAGQAFNIGGGPSRTLSLLQLIEIIADLADIGPRYETRDWRPGDQRYYVSDTRKFSEVTGWSAQVGAHEGVERLYEWLRLARGLSAARTLGRPRRAGPFGRKPAMRSSSALGRRERAIGDKASGSF